MHTFILVLWDGNGFLTFGMMYWLIPRLHNTQLYSKKLASNHFWIGTLGILLYAIPMYWSAFRSYFMMKAFTPEGQLQYQFMDIVQTIIPFYIIRAIGGTIFLIGVFIMIYNLVKTAKQGSFVESETGEAPPLEKNYVAPSNSIWHSFIERKPVLLLVLSLISRYRWINRNRSNVLS
ncbi:MAG: cbb3-type cytochrome c oxidase subunit I [Saprospiraceae bacterium]|nr:cbb3-type cytochrome c oxidase subunit I [Saprospiraceae bacterium]